MLRSIVLQHRRSEPLVDVMVLPDLITGAPV